MRLFFCINLIVFYFSFILKGVIQFAIHDAKSAISTISMPDSEFWIVSKHRPYRLLSDNSVNSGQQVSRFLRMLIGDVPQSQQAANPIVTTGINC